MQDNGFILSECEDINSSLYKPIISTQRIKYTCINASSNYIVVGSTSGSLYLFSREPCVFQQLIPLSEGPVTRVLISPDEKTVALATKRGSVCVVSIKPSIKLLSISNEHVDNTVTCLCWNNKSSEVYVGDNNGKISTIILSIFTVNGMFQAPSCVLMHLDSSVVQVDFSIRYLLVSTLTRSYICDTSQEQFKQIGNKTRDGEFGSCFLNLSLHENKTNQSPEDTDKASLTGGINAIIGLNDDTEDSNLKIFCSRPGCRLWEVTPNGIVVKTHQFRKALEIPPSNIFQSTLIKHKPVEEPNESEVLNFSQLLVIRKKYLLSYNRNEIFIIDPIGTNVILKTDSYKNILSANVVNDKIYLMTKTKTFHCLMLSRVDYLILKLYNSNLLSDCFNLCQMYRSQLEQMIKQYKIDINDDSDLNFDENASIKPVISALQFYSNNQSVKLQSGIVVVNSGDHKIKQPENESESSESEIICDFGLKKEVRLSFEHSEDFISTESRTNDLELTTLSIQSDLEPMYLLINTLKSALISGNLNEVESLINEVNSKLLEIVKKYEQNDGIENILFELVKFFKRNYYHVLLDNINQELISKINDNLISEVVNGLIDINKSKCIIDCDCGFKQLNERLIDEPKYFKLGQILIDSLIKGNVNQFIHVCNNIPYFWRFYLTVFINEKQSINDNLMCLIQTKDNIILSILLPALSSKQWIKAVDYINKLEINVCLSCNKKLKTGNEIIRINWNEIAHEFVKEKGSDAALTFLAQIQKSFPHVKFKDTIYQSVIFSKLLEHSGFKQNIKFDGNKLKNHEYTSICSPEVQEVLAKALEKDIEKPVKKSIFGNGAHHWGMRLQTKPSICSFCTLSLQTPVLLGNNGISIFPCGHAYHFNCLVQKKMTKCYLHSSNSSINQQNN